ncbi:Large subunit GTPase 1-like protein [Armadillidium nasatum]|uniref:Large subunit GTPase 1 homolog n=1 Tax=Armadillidium nasatum TaxID=96803 RepID=A0A5N5SSM8_9CRUS|nr:Large subunit GTPase 1-like protein [Armadillidium nasatum]
MSKKQKKQKDCLGRYLIKDRLKIKHGSNFKNSPRHTTEVEEGKHYNPVNYKSITDQTDVEDFLTTAELAGTEFKAERLNAKIIVPTATQGIISDEERVKIAALQDKNREHLRIPRRPPWDRSMDAEELDASEKESFLQWRRALALLQEEDGIVITPYEKNLQFWRQLWRVIERSDVVVQIVDARNPLLFLCNDLIKYVKEVDVNKENLLLVNKADFLTQQQREIWASYFKNSNINAVFFSATTLNLDDIEEEEEVEGVEDAGDENSQSKESLHSHSVEEEVGNNLNNLNVSDEINNEQEGSNEESVDAPEDKDLKDSISFKSDSVHREFINSPKILSREELIEVFTYYYKGPKLNSEFVTVGLVGYPNVGKSSSINALMQEKKVSVSATPGKTKHFQTLFLSNELQLCDCPGLVFPAFVSTREDLILSGILPIDEMRFHVPPMNLLLSLFPRNVLELTYGVKLPLPREEENPDRSPTSEEFLTVYGHMRGFMTQRGIPDHPRCARYILKDYINGKLLYCHSPPGVCQEEFHKFVVKNVKRIPSQHTSQELSSISYVPKQQILNRLSEINEAPTSGIGKKDKKAIKR